MLINNRELHIETIGPENGHPVVFLHHGLGSTRSWRGQMNFFARKGYRVLTYDRWGYGKSEQRPYLSVPGFEDDLADLQGILEASAIQRPILIGHSDGGTIAIYYAALYPDQVNCLVTVAAHIYLESKMEPGIQDIKLAFDEDPHFRKGMKRSHGEKFESTFNNWFNSWHTPAALELDLRPLLTQITCPTLVIQGEDDEHASPQHAIDLAGSVPGAVIWLVPGARHMLPQEMAKTFNHKTIEFLNNAVIEDV